MAAPEEEEAQQEGATFLGSNRSPKDIHQLNCKFYNYGIASTQITQPKLQQRNILPPIPKISADLEPLPARVVLSQDWNRVDKVVQEADHLTSSRATIIGFFDDLETDTKMATTKADMKEKLERTLIGRVQTPPTFHDTELSYLVTCADNFL